MSSVSINEVPLIFVWLGNVIPRWCNNSLRINKALNKNREIIFLANSSLKNKIIKEIKFVELESFYDERESKFAINLLNSSNFRDGFWQKTYERFFVLKSFMISKKISRIYHAEIDNICILNKDLEKNLNYLGEGFYVPQDSNDRAIASLVYINNIESLNFLCKLENEILNSYTNEMELLSYCINNSNLFHALPTESHVNGLLNKENLKTQYQVAKLGGIFDAASIGQYMFGIDHRNSSSLLIRNKYINPVSINDWTKTLISIDNSGEKINIIIKNKKFNLYNIHIHSKIFKSSKDLYFINNILNNDGTIKNKILKINIIGFLKTKLYRIYLKIIGK